MASIDMMDRIRRSLENLTTLEIITSVGEIAPGALRGEGEKSDLTAEDARHIMTRIDLLQGDIRTVFAEEFVTGNYQNLRTFHEEREKEGYRIIHKNLATLERLLSLVRVLGSSTADNPKTGAADAPTDILPDPALDIDDAGI